MQNISPKHLSLTGLLPLILPLSVLAAPPDAGQILQEQRSQKPLPSQLPPQADVEKTPEKTENGIRILVKGFTFSGYEGLLSEPELQSLVAKDIGKKLSFDELQSLVTRVTHYLRSQGWLLARAYLPDQDITSGVIHIAIIQGKSDGSLTVIGDETLRIGKEHLQHIGEHAIQKNTPLKAQDLERSLLLMNDLPGISAKASLSPGEAPGTTAVKIKATEGALFDGSLWFDNYGNRYTGAERGNAMVNINDPHRIGDRFTFLFTTAEHLKVGQVSYSAPISTSGLRADLSYTDIRYELGKELSSLDADGNAHTVNVGVSYPWIRSRRANITTTVNYEFKDLSDSASGTKLHDKQLHSATLGTAGDMSDVFFGGGVTSWGASVTHGSMNERTADIAITDTEGSYTFFNINLARLQKLTKDLMMRVSLRSQYSLDNLDSSEQFSLGGPYGVRAYPVSEAMGDEGHLFNLEASYAIAIPERFGDLKWNIFYDAGQIVLHKNTWANAISTATNKNRYWLQGAGTGFDYSYDDNRQSGHPGLMSSAITMVVVLTIMTLTVRMMKIVFCFRLFGVFDALLKEFK